MYRAIFLTLVSVLASPAVAESPHSGIVSYTVLPGWRQEDGTRLAALQLELAPGWKTYWRTPGDAGIPPHFSWRSARNLHRAQVLWPAPIVFWEAGMRSIGYKETVVLPITLTPKRQNQPIRLKGRIDLGVCSDICIPTTLKIDANLPANTGMRDPKIVAALAAMPFSAQEAGVENVSCSMSPLAHGLKLSVQITMPAAGAREHAVIETVDPTIWVSDPQTDRAGSKLSLEAKMVGQSDGPLALGRSDVRITVIGTNYSVDIRGC